MKKLISLLLCALMLLSLAATAFAQPPEDNPNEDLALYAADACKHDWDLYKATCDGVEQTWYYRCTSCKETYTDTLTCPKAGHTGPCHWLPI